MKFLIFNLSLIAIALGIARQMGITIPHIPAPCTKEFALIISAQSVISFFSSHISKLLTDQPKRYQGDEDGVLDVKLLENKRKENQGILLFTTGLVTCIILLAHLFCQDGPWTGLSPDEDVTYVLMIVFGSIGEFLALLFAIEIVAQVPHARLKATLDAHHRTKAAVQLQNDNWVEVGSDPSCQTIEDRGRSWGIAKDHPEWVDVKSTDGL